MNAIQRYVPTEPGYYYYQDDPYGVPSIALVWENGPGHLVVHTHGYHGCFYADDEIFRWLGPVQDAYRDVKEFHEKFATSIIGIRPRFPAFEYYGTEFIIEELKELQDAELRRDMAGIADAMADMIYVIYRKAIIMGIDLRPVHALVHAANMKKEGGEMREDKKVMKPLGWIPPDIAGEMKRQGWEG